MSSTASIAPARFRTPLERLSSRIVSGKQMRQRAGVQSSSPAPSGSEELIEQHLKQVQMIAKKIRQRLPAHVELDDLIGYGTVGLMNAVEGFDPSRGTLLKTYAEHRIRGAILDGLRGMNWLSRSACRRKAQLERSSGAAAIGAPVDTLPASPSKTARMSAQDHPRRGAARSPAALGTTLIEIICGGWFLEDLEQISERAGWRRAAGMGSQAEDPEEIYRRKELKQQMSNAVARLPLRERALVEMRYEREMSMTEISRILGVHPSRVSQLHAQAMQRLKPCFSAALSPLPRSIAAKPCAPIAL